MPTPAPLFDTLQIRRAHPIVDFLAARGVSLRRVGRHLVCRCPLHEERNGSAFVIFPEEGRWKCFGKCQAGGDVIHLVMRLEGCDFREACRRLGGERAAFSCAESHHTILYRGDEIPAEPAALTEEQVYLKHDAAAYLSLRPELCERVARARGWKVETIHDLALDEHLGWHEGALAFLYPHGMKLRSTDPAGTRRIRWLFGGNHELWRGDLLLQGARQPSGARRLRSSPQGRGGRPSQSQPYHSKLLGISERLGQPRSLTDPRSLWLCEGETDAISLLDAGREDDANLVLALPCASAWHSSWRPHFVDREVVLLLDNDAAGQRATQRLTHELRGAASHIFSIHPQAPATLSPPSLHNSTTP